MDIFEAEYLIKTLMCEHLEKYKIFYTFDWIPEGIDNRFLGLCCYADKMLLFHTNFIHNSSEENVRKVILHEIAHVLAGSKAKHDKFFAKKCREIGLIDKKFIQEET